MYFIYKIAPLLEKNNVKYRYFLAGDIDREELNLIISRSRLNNLDCIYILGRVVDVADFYKHIDMLIAPISSGSGSRIKILEALSFGTPVITSKIGAEGIVLIPDYIRIADSAKKYFFLINRIYKDLRSKIYTDNHNLLKKKLTELLWERIFKKYAQT